MTELHNRGTIWSLPRVHTSCAHGHAMPVSLKHGLVIVSEYERYKNTRLNMYSLADGSLVRTIGSKGIGKGQFAFVYGGLCMAPDGDGTAVCKR